MFQIDDLVWVKTTEYCASKARITGFHEHGYYVRFVDKTFDQASDDFYPVMKHKVCAIDYIGWEK